MLGRFFNRQVQLLDRDGERYDISLRVLSRELPGYRGVTLDLSRSGVQLETSGLLEIGSTPLLNFEFDRGELENFECRAKVVWSKQEENSRSKFRSGLNFLPDTDDQRRQIAKMSTVLQARSETDLNTLLDQALRIDPELERSYATISQQQRSQMAPEEPSAPGAVAGPSSAKEKRPHPGVYIPLNVVLEGYTWNRACRTLHLGLREGELLHSLFFPHCQLFQVLEPAVDEKIVGLYSTKTSPVTRKLELSETAIEYKHYRFVASGGKGLIDIVSDACRPSAE